MKIYVAIFFGKVMERTEKCLGLSGNRFLLLKIMEGYKLVVWCPLISHYYKMKAAFLKYDDLGQGGEGVA